MENTSKIDAVKALKVRRDALYDMFFTEYKEFDALRKDRNYSKYLNLSRERYKLRLSNDKIVKEMSEDKVKAGIWELETSQQVCEFYLYQLYWRTKDIIDIPELYQAKISMLEPNEREYIINLIRIDELNKQIEPLEEKINIIDRELEKHYIILSYLKTQINTIEINLPLEKIKAKKHLEKRKLEVEYRLSQYNEWYNIENEIMQLNEEKESCHSMKAIKYGDKVQNSKISDTTEDAVEKILGLDEKIKRKRASQSLCEDNKKWVDSVFSSCILSQEEVQLIRLHYFTGYAKKKPLPKVANEMNYSLDRVKHKKTEILRKMISKL